MRPQAIVLYQLSYSPMLEMVELVGLEPTTSRLQVEVADDFSTRADQDVLGVL